ncbi:hypothetical protein [Sediminitomix flava]|uniref:Uncharacterized protein n=1 Tax=Sediminitomix flava TaxID=379075 RepID=A0A315ZBN8_SEDFL|nr:hypothetical protein [Sediminitomix flava]PWJ42961.1 hypothetical protein BC781_102508 [Sediminitomix flava]
MESKDIYKALLAMKGSSEDFSEFNKLTDYQKKRLPNVNFWKYKNEETPINIPEDFEEYWSAIESNISEDHGEDG